MAYFKLKENGRCTTDSLTTSFSPEIGQKILIREVPHLYPEERSIFISEDRGQHRGIWKTKQNKNQTGFTKFHPVQYLELISITFSTLSTFCSSANLVLKALRFSHFFRSLLTYEGSMYVHGFLLLICLLPIQFTEAWSKSLRQGEEICFPLHYSIVKRFRTVTLDRFYFYPGFST